MVANEEFKDGIWHHGTYHGVSLIPLWGLLSIKLQNKNVRKRL